MKKFIQEVLAQAKEEDELATKKQKAMRKQEAMKKHNATKKHKATTKDKAAEDDEDDSNHGVGLNVTISALCNKISGLLLRQPREAESILAKFEALSMLLSKLQRLPFAKSTLSSARLHCEAGLASILDKTTRDVIQARIDQLEEADSTQEDEKLYRSLLDLLGETKVGFLCSTCSYGFSLFNSWW